MAESVGGLGVGDGLRSLAFGAALFGANTLLEAMAKPVPQTALLDGARAIEPFALYRTVGASIEADYGVFTHDSFTA